MAVHAAKILAYKYFYGDIECGTDPSARGRESSLKQVIDRVAGALSYRKILYRPLI